MLNDQNQVDSNIQSKIKSKSRTSKKEEFA